MSESGPDAIPDRPLEVEVLDEQEQSLRQLLGDEHQYLVDLLQAGIEADEFRKSRAGVALLKDLQQQMKAALAVLRDPDKNTEETLAAAYKLRIAYAATNSIAAAIQQGRRAESDIDRFSGDQE
jgi:hypothetical protein